MDQAGPGRPSRPASGTAQTLDNDGTATAADGQTAATPEGGQTAAPGVDGAGRTAFSRIRATARHPVAIQLAVLAGFIAAGSGLLDDGHELRAGDKQGDACGQCRGP